MSEEAKTDQVKRVVKYEIYKTKGAIQFKLAPAYSLGGQDGALKEKGCVFIDAAPATGQRQYGFQDPAKKITFALSVTDIGKIVVGFKSGKFNLVHDPGAQTDKRGQVVKQFSMWKGKDNDADGLPTYFLKISHEEGRAKREVTVPIDSAEACVLSRLLEAAIPRILYWA